MPLPSNRERNISPEILGVHRSFSTMAISSHSTSQPDQNPQAENHLEDQQQQRCICQGHFSHNEHQKWPALFSPVAQQLTEIGFTYMLSCTRLALGLLEYRQQWQAFERFPLLSTTMPFRTLPISLPCCRSALETVRLMRTSARGLSVIQTSNFPSQGRNGIRKWYLQTWDFPQRTCASWRHGKCILVSFIGCLSR